MELATIFLSTFLIVAIGELGDKTQIATGVGTLANRKYAKIIFFSTSLALISVNGLTIFFAGLIPETYLPNIIKVGGFLLIIYGIYLFHKTEMESFDEQVLPPKNIWGLFLTHFSVVFIAEMGDKTQIIALAIALENKLHLFIVFLASALALILVTTVTIWGVTKIPEKWLGKIQKLGAVIMIAYGIYMIF